MAPTGSGKTFLGLRAIHEALQRGKRAVFVCDRRTLIEQTSAVADSYGLTAHSVLMADHWRYDRCSRFQIASAQTLASDPEKSALSPRTAASRPRTSTPARCTAFRSS